MRHATRIAVIAALLGLLALPALGGVSKVTFNDVVLPDGQVGEIEAAVKVLKNKDDSVNCTYFTDDYATGLGYYFDFEEPAVTEPAEVLQFCLDHYDERST